MGMGEQTVTAHSRAVANKSYEEKQSRAEGQRTVAVLQFKSGDVGMASPEDDPRQGRERACWNLGAQGSRQRKGQVQVQVQRCISGSVSFVPPPLTKAVTNGSLSLDYRRTIRGRDSRGVKQGTGIWAGKGRAVSDCNTLYFS